VPADRQTSDIFQPNDQPPTSFYCHRPRSTAVPPPTRGRAPGLAGSRALMPAWRPGLGVPGVGGVPWRTVVTVRREVVHTSAGGPPSHVTEASVRRTRDDRPPATLTHEFPRQMSTSSIQQELPRQMSTSSTQVNLMVFQPFVLNQTCRLLCRDVHGNGIPNGNGNLMGMGIKHGSGNGNGRKWKTTWMGMGITCTPVGMGTNLNPDSTNSLLFLHSNSK